MLIKCYNDGKEKSQSFEVYIEDETSFYEPELDMWSYNPCDIIGYGKTKEEAINNFISKMKIMLDFWNGYYEKILQPRLFVAHNVDAFGKDKEE